MKKALLLLTVAGALLAACSFLINESIEHKSRGLIYEDAERVPPGTAALVLGASVHGGGRLSHVLEDRMEQALLLYKMGRVKKLLLSGDHGTRRYDEVNSMRQWLLERKVRPADIFLDHAGFSTYNSVVRAKRVFLVSDVVIVTQRYHLPRALYIAVENGMTARGLAADRRTYVHIRYYRFREFFANLRAFFDVATDRRPKFLGSPVPITGDGRKSWD